MAAATILHIGEDRHHRVPILQNAGYLVDNCSSIPDLSNIFQSNTVLSAVVMTDGNLGMVRNAVSLTRTHSVAPIIFFPGTATAYSESDFDLVIPSFTDPQQWLNEVARVIDWSLELRSESQVIRETSRLLREESVKLRQKSHLQQEQSARQRERMNRFLKRDPWDIT